MTYPLTEKAMRLTRAKVEVADRLMSDKVAAIRAGKRIERAPYFTTKRADYGLAELRMVATSMQTDDPVIRNYRIVADAPNYPEIEQLVRWIARRYGHDEAELFGDVMDSICEDTEWPIPTDARHLKARFVRRAYLISTTGKYRRNRIKSKLTMPISTLERQEKSPSYNPYIGEKSETLPVFSADRVHYIGHKAPGLPELEAFNKSGHVDEYLRSKSLDKLSDALHLSVRYLRNRGGLKGHHYAIVWTKLARQFGLGTRQQVNDFKAKVTDLISGIPDDFCRDKSRWTVVKGRWVISAYTPEWDTVIVDINRQVTTAEWRVSHTKKNAIIDHYREHMAPDKCRECSRIEVDIIDAARTNSTLLTDWLSR